MQTYISSCNQVLINRQSLTKSKIHERLKHLKITCNEHWNPKTCYLAIDISKSLKFSWSCRTSDHFGKDYQDITHRQYLSLIHPAWEKMYSVFEEMAWTKLYEPIREGGNGITYCITVPLMGRNGAFYWYDQVLLPVISDESGRSVVFLKSLHRLGGYGTMWPNPPFLMRPGTDSNEFDNYFQKAGSNVLNFFLDDLLTKSQVDFIKAYRTLDEVLDGCSPDRSKAYVEMGVSLASYDRMLQRIMDRLDVKLSDFWIRSAHDFCLFLNHYFSV